jgi:hypothetical protein
LLLSRSCSVFFLNIIEPVVALSRSLPRLPAPRESPSSGANRTIRGQARFLGKPLEAAVLPEVAHFSAKLAKRDEFSQANA